MMAAPSAPGPSPAYDAFPPTPEAAGAGGSEPTSTAPAATAPEGSPAYPAPRPPLTGSVPTQRPAHETAAPDAAAPAPVPSTPNAVAPPQAAPPSAQGQPNQVQPAKSQPTPSQVPQAQPTHPQPAQPQPVWQSPPPQQPTWMAAPTAPIGPPQPAPSAPPPTGPNGSFGFVGGSVPWNGGQSPTTTPARRGPRLGLILGIAVPVAVVVILGIVAALVVPGIITDRNAQDSADAYQQERSAWESVYSDTALEPFTSLETSDFDSALISLSNQLSTAPDERSALDSAPLTAACDRLAGIQPAADALTAPRPTIVTVEGGERNADYRAALADLEASTPQFDAAETLSQTIQGPFADIAGGCALVQAQIAADATFVGAIDALRATYTIPSAGTEEYWFYAYSGVKFTCNNPDGCPSFVDRAGRARTADAWDAAFTTFETTMANSFRDHCPTADLRGTCDAWAAFYDANAAASKKVADAYRTEDVVAAARGGGSVAAPQVDAANAAYSAQYDTGYDQVSTQTQADTGYENPLQFVAGTTTEAAATIREQATIIRG